MRPLVAAAIGAGSVAGLGLLLAFFHHYRCRRDARVLAEERRAEAQAMQARPQATRKDPRSRSALQEHVQPAALPPPGRHGDALPRQFV